MKEFLKGFSGVWLGMYLGASLMGGFCAFIDELSELATSGDSTLLFFYLFLLCVCGIAGAKFYR